MNGKTGKNQSMYFQENVSSRDEVRKAQKTDDKMSSWWC
jgi:hypothetical protein